jgi:Lar family restriction alleviation protein
MSGISQRRCPFCGAAPSVVRDEVRKPWHAELVVSGARVACACGASTQRASTENVAAEAWNTKKVVRIQRISGGN